MPGDRGSIFISYRRDDTRHIAGRLADTLAGSFGGDRVFMDVESIEPGLDFTEAIDQAVAQCDALIVLIGPAWVSAPDADGQRRIDDPDDFVTLEVEAALRRNVRVIPVLVDGARMPSRDQLPVSLEPLARRNAVRLDHESYRTDAATLLGVLGRVLGASSRSDTSPPQSESRSTEELASTQPAPHLASNPASTRSGAGKKPGRADATDQQAGRKRRSRFGPVWAAALAVLAVLLVTSALMLDANKEPSSEARSPGDSPTASVPSSSSPSRTAKPQKVRCWDGTTAATALRCPRPEGRSGLTSVFPSMTQKCRLVPAPTVEGKAEVYLCEELDFIVRYTWWTPGSHRVEHYDEDNPGASKAAWRVGGEEAGFQWTSFNPSAVEQRRYQWSAAYVANPYSVSVEAVSDAVRKRVIRSVEAVRPSRLGARG